MSRVAFELERDGRTVVVVAQAGRLWAWKAGGRRGVGQSREAAVRAAMAAYRASRLTLARAPGPACWLAQRFLGRQP